MTRRYDTVVVGAGPAGSATAYRLASAGATVLLLDRERFPRVKPCGGGVTGRAAREIPFSIDPVVEDVVTTAELRLAYRHSTERGGSRPLCFMTQRKRLDHFLAERAEEAGAEFRDGVKVTGVEMVNGCPVVRAGGERIATDAIVGADGVNGVTARALGLGGNQAVGVALEGNMPFDRIDPDRYAGRFTLELGSVPGGYGWVFPKRDHANFGVGGWSTEGPRLREHLDRLCEEHGVRSRDLEDVRGYRLPCRASNSKLAGGRALVVGDAAGLVDPLTGDGMYEAFLSGRFAAEAVQALLRGEASSLDPYGERVNRELSVHLWASWSVKVALDRFPRTAFALTKSQPVWRVVERLVTGEVADVRGAHALARLPLKAISLLARAAGDPGRAYRAAA